MTDAELIERLRTGATWDDDVAAADRIEALTLERDIMSRAIAYIFDKYGLELPDPTDQRTGNN